jgi:hypothetical protein
MEKGIDVISDIPRGGEHIICKPTIPGTIVVLGDIVKFLYEYPGDRQYPRVFDPDGIVVVLHTGEGDKYVALDTQITAHRDVCEVKTLDGETHRAEFLDFELGRLRCNIDENTNSKKNMAGSH